MKAEEFGNEIRRLRRERKFTIRLLEERSGVSNSYLSQIENGKRGIPSPEILKQLSIGLDFPYEELMRMAGYLSSDESPIDNYGEKSDNSTYTQWNREHSEKVISIALERMRKESDIDSDIAMIPVLGTIKAGYDLYADQQVIDVQPVAKATVADGAEYFYLVVKGNSMIGDGIREGMRVLVRRQEYVEDGKVGVVLINGDEATLKRVYRRDDELMLISSNPEFPPRSVHISEARIQGQIKQVVWDFE